MQLAIASLGGSVAKTEWERLQETLVQAIALITPKELCWRLKITEQYLSDAIKERDRKSIRAAWIPVILAMAPDSARRDILEVLAKPAGYDVQRRRELTAEERLARMEERMTQRFGQAGLELVEELRK